MFDSIGSVLGSDSNLIFSVVAIVVLIALAYIVFRLARQPSFASGRRNKQARLAVTDAISFGSTKHKLVLVRRDDIEHLVLVGGTTDLVVESNIRRNTAVRPREQPPLEPVSASAIPPAPKVEQDSKPSSPPRLRPVANEPPSQSARPQFVPRQEQSGAPKPPPADHSRSAASLATPHVRSAADSDTPIGLSKVQPKPLPPVASPTAPAVIGGLVAAPLAVATATGIGDQEQESPFKDTSQKETKASVANDTTPPATTTVAPRDPAWGSSPANTTEKGQSNSTSVAEDMDALLNELSAKS